MHFPQWVQLAVVRTMSLLWNLSSFSEQGSSSSQDDIYEPIAGAEDMNADSDSDGWGSEEFEEYSEGDISEGLGQASAESVYENVPPKNIKRKSIEGAQVMKNMNYKL